MNSEKYDYLLKIIVVGDAAVGKTALSVRFTEGKFKDDYKMTIGVDFSIKKMEVDNKIVKIQIWDTGGQEQFSYVRPMYYKGSLGGYIVFDKTNRSSFYNIAKWFKEVYDNSGQIPLILVGNKIDLPDIQVTTKEAKAIAKEYGIPYFETSAKSGASVNAAFESLVRMIIDPKYRDKLSAEGVEYEKPQILNNEAYQQYNSLANQATAYFQIGNLEETLNCLKNALHWAKETPFDEGIHWCEDQIVYISQLLKIDTPIEVKGIILMCPKCSTYFNVDYEGQYSCPKCLSVLQSVTPNLIKIE